MSSIFQKEVVVVGASLNNEFLKLYLKDLSTLEIKQGDPKLAEIMDQVIIDIASKGESVVKIDIDTKNKSISSIYAAYQEKSNGLVKFFVTAKRKLLGENLKPLTEIPVKGFILDAMPITAEDESLIDDEQDTVFAVVNDQVITNVEDIKEHIKHNVKHNHEPAMNKFFERIANVVANRRHSMEDLFKFIKNADLPIAADGSIIAYKLLKQRSENDIYFYDCHTNKVKQKVGSKVFVKEELVDPNRSRDCSNGLHIAALHYLNTFSGNVVVLVKINPEDVIAVPEYSNTKMRVKAYQIIHKLSDESFKILKSGQSLSSGKDFKIVQEAISGKKYLPAQLVEITEHNGNGLVITELDEQERYLNHEPKVEPESNELSTPTGLPGAGSSLQNKSTSTPKCKKVIPAINLNPEKEKSNVTPSKPDLKNTVSPSDIAKKVQASKAKPVINLSYREQILNLLTKLKLSEVNENNKKIALEIYALKKKVKKSYDFLGVTTKQQECISRNLK